jgi:phosphoglycerate dehydrogenase-like enzyme
MSDQFVLLILGKPTEQFLDRISEVQRWAEVRIASNLEQAGKSIPEADVILVLAHTGAWLRDHWNSAVKLRWIHTDSTGVEDLLFPALERRPVWLTNSRGAYSSALAEFVMLCVLFFAKAVPDMERNRQKHVWDAYPVKEVRGQTIGIVGFGETGQAVSRLARAFGMSVVATKRNSQATAATEETAQLVPSERWHELLSVSDYIVNALPLTAETLRRFGDREFRAMKQTSFFVNVGRGKTVDESSLVKALKEGWIAGAGLARIIHEQSEGAQL